MLPMTPTRRDRRFARTYELNRIYKKQIREMQAALKVANLALESAVQRCIILNDQLNAHRSSASRSLTQQNTKEE